MLAVHDFSFHLILLSLFFFHELQQAKAQGKVLWKCWLLRWKISLEKKNYWIIHGFFCHFEPELEPLPVLFGGSSVNSMPSRTARC